MATQRRRPHDAPATRRALLDAASRLFDERGYDRATVREIGDCAGVDPALIARYFGGKEGLYLAVLSDPQRGGTFCLEDEDLVAFARRALTRSQTRGHSPITRAMVGAEPSEEVREQARAILDERAVRPLAQHLREHGVDRPRLRAELLLAMVTGVTVLRANGLLDELATSSTDELLEILEPVVGALGSSG